MKFDVVESVKNLLGVEEGSNVEFVFDNIGSVAPYISGAITSHRINRLKKRLEEHQERLMVIESKLQKKDAAFNEFLKQKAFPIILEDIMNDAQDEKVEFLFNGFENIIDQEVKDENRILAYCDVLRELRIDEIKRLLTYTGEYRYNVTPKLNKLLSVSASEEEIKKHYENQAYKKYIQNRLERMGLLGIVASPGKDNMESIQNIAKSEIGISTFGRHLIEFFDLTSLIKDGQLI
ncbi:MULTISPECIES: hypothetical protein [unclassified Bacillus cereus group]|uniref:hypothetical protein n=1 Tax=unclassified Bacillus cereus group TaxID=2750818 RepID=UPI0032F8395E|nr:hypothetical protein [Bacillus cereus]HDR8066175.1 hypothetical protein [Bacillus cereus]